MMSERITEEQVANLLAVVTSNAAVEVKVQGINSAKSSIKQNNVPDASVMSLFEITRTAMSSPHASLVSAGFSTLGHLLTRLSRQEPKYLVKEAARTLPFLIDRTGDAKEKYRTLAAQCLTTFWKASPMDVERAVRNTGMIGKSSRAKETCMKWLLQMHQEAGLQFRSFVPSLMELLEDADGAVRDSAKATVISLFQNAPNSAKSDLKKQLKNFNVRPAIASSITDKLAQNAPTEMEQPAIVVQPSRSVFADSVSSQASAATIPSFVPEVKVEKVEPLYINTARELDEAFQDMTPFFEGKESEQNWLKREESCTKLRRINAGNAPSDFRDVWLLGLKALLDGILKAVNSLRTSLSKEGCSLVQEAAKTNGPGLDPMVEILLQNLVKLCGGTKKISSQNGNITVDIIIGKVSYGVRLLQHIWLACQDKNVQPRTYATGWLKTLINKEAHHKNVIEHGGGLELIEKCVKKGLADPNPGVRENMRSTYWTFAKVWPARAELIMASLDAVQQNKLEQDPSNPNTPKKAEPAAARPGMGFSKSINGPSKPSLRETMLNEKRKAAMTAKNLPPRPGSAMSSFASPSRSTSTALAPTGPARSGKLESGNARGRPESTSSASVPHGGLFKGVPMRPTKARARPEIARPATAGPYSVRRPVNNGESTTTSPVQNQGKTNVASVISSASSPKRMAARPNTSQSSHSAQSSVNHISPGKGTASKISQSPRGSTLSKLPKSPARSTSRPPLSRRATPSRSRPVDTLPTSRHEELTMVIPAVSLLNGISTPPRPNHDEVSKKEGHSVASTPPKPVKVYEDPSDGSPRDDTAPRPLLAAPVLEELPVNEDTAYLIKNGISTMDATRSPLVTPENSKLTSKLLDSGISRIQEKSLDVHLFRKLQALLRDKQSFLDNAKFEAILLGLFDYLEAPLKDQSPEKVQDIKAQILVTINLMLKKDREAFRPHVPRGLQSLLITRACYDARAHIVNGLLSLSEELVALSDAQATTDYLIRVLQKQQMTPEGCRTLSMGLHVLRALLAAIVDFSPSDIEIDSICKLTLRCLDSSESGVRQDAVQLCVTLHSRIGEQKFWESMSGVKADPKSLITYYIVKKERESISV